MDIDAGVVAVILAYFGLVTLIAIVGCRAARR